MENQDKYYTVVKDYNGKEVAKVHTGMLAKSITVENFAELLEDFVNSGMKDYRDGEFIGKILQTSHRTLQASVIRLCLGIIVGLSKQDYTDARNETPIEMSKQIARMIENGELRMGYMI